MTKFFNLNITHTILIDIFKDSLSIRVVFLCRHKKRNKKKTFYNWGYFKQKRKQFLLYPLVTIEQNSNN